AAPGIAARGLDVSVRPGTDPDIRPRWRDGQRADTAQLLPVADRPAVGADVAELLPRAPALDPGNRIADIAQPCRPRCLMVYSLHASKLFIHPVPERL